MKTLIRFSLLIASLLMLATLAIGQETRSITSEDFTKKRPVPGVVGAKRPNAKPKTYDFVRKDKNVIRWKASFTKRKPRPKLPIAISDIGVTIWKMRSPLRADVGIKLPVEVNGSIEMWIAERVPATSAFQAGDMIRIGIESPTAGYLYVINSEISSDGSFGDPILLFPWPAETYNWVGPGMLVDIPGQQERNPYFRLNPAKGNYAGELVAIVISPLRLNFKTGDKGKILNLDKIIDLDANFDVEIFGRTDNDDQVFSKVESQATCGSTARQLERSAPGQNPCGVGSRELTRDEPPPQSIYRVKKYQGRPAIALIRLNAGN